MDERDANVGFWIKDEFYLYTPNDDHTKAERKYGCLEKPIGCNNYVSNYFLPLETF